MHNLKVTISARLFNKHGKLIRTYRPRPAHSFLAQFIELLYVQISQGQTLITKTDGAEENRGPYAPHFSVNAPASNITWGLLIGSGTDAVNIDDYALQTPITTDLTASVHSFALSYPTPSSRRLTISRTFNNASVSPIAIEEVALYSYLSPSTKACIDRTLYSVAIPASSSLELTYRITVSV